MPSSQSVYLDALAAKYGATLGTHKSAPKVVPVSTAPAPIVSGISAAGAIPTDGTQPTSFLGHLIDVLSRPAYAMGQSIKDVEAAKTPFDTIKAAQPLAYVKNLFANDKQMPSQTLNFMKDWKAGTADTSVGNDFLKTAASFALDVGLDPTTYIPGAAFVKGAKIIGKATGLAREGVNVARGAKVMGAKLTAEELAALSNKAGAAVAAPVVSSVKPEAVASATAGLTATDIKGIVAAEKAAMATKTAPVVLPKITMAETLAAKADASLAVKAEKTANKISDGTFVPAVTKETAIASAATKADAGTSAVNMRVLTHNVTGNEVPFTQKLLEKTAEHKAYPRLNVASPFVPKALDIPVAPIAESAAPVALAAEKIAPAVAAAPAVPLEFKAWIRANPNIAIHTGPKLTTTMPNALERINSVTATLADKQRFAGYLRAEHAQYVTDFAKNAAAPIAPTVANVIPTLAETMAKAAPDVATPVSKQALTEAARGSGSAIPGFDRLQGPALEAWKAEVLAKVGKNADYHNLLAKKTPESFNAAVTEMKSRTVRVPVYTEKIMQLTPEQLVADIKAATPEAAAFVGRTPKGYETSAHIVEARRTAEAFNAAKESAIVPTERIAAGMVRTPEQLAAVARGEGLSTGTRDALLAAMDYQQWAGVKPNFPYITDIQKTLRDAMEGHVGVGVNREAANGMFQGNLFRALVKQASADAALVKGLVNFSRGQFMYEHVMPNLKAAEDFLHANGAVPIASFGHEGYPVGLSDIIEGLYSSGHHGELFVKGRIFDLFGVGDATKGTVYTTTLLDVTRRIADQLSKVTDVKTAAELRTAITKLIPDMQGTLREGLTTPGITMGPKAIAVSASHAAAVVNQAADLFTNPEVISKIFDAVMQHTAEYGVMFNAEVKQLTEATMSNIIDVLHSPLFSDGEKIHTILNTKEIVAGAGQVGHASNAVIDGTKQAVDQAMLDVVSVDVHQAAVDVSNLSKAVISGDREAVLKAAQTAHNNAVGAAHSATDTIELLNSGNASEIAMQASVFRKMNPLVEWVGETFNPAFRQATLHAAIPVTKNIASVLQKGWRHSLNLASNAHSGEDLAFAVDWLQHGNDVAKAPEKMRDAIISLKPTLNQMFESDIAVQAAHGKPVESALGAFFRNGFDPKHLNARLEFAYHDTNLVAPQFIYKTDKAGVPIITDAVMNQWRDWKIPDKMLNDGAGGAVDFLGRMEHAFAGLSMDMASSQEVWRLASSLGYASTVPRKGMMRWTSQADSFIGRYLPKNAWFDPDILPEIQQMDKMLSMPTAIQGSLGHWVSHYMDPIMNIWKSGMTVWNPGHHVRNVVGDTGLSFYAHGVSNPKYYRDAIRMQGLRGEYDGWSALAAMQGYKATGKTLTRKLTIGVKINGKTQQFTDREIHQGLMDRGFFNDFRVQEDLLDSAGNNPAIENLSRRLQLNGGKTKQTIGKISEAREDFVRLGHALHLFDNGITVSPRLTQTGKGFKDLNDALDQVTAQVRKWHPDGSDLANREAKYLRRIFPFYSWTRKAIPLIAETILTRPGRYLAYPKATFDYANTHGVNPQSMSNPFPEDQNFPAYMQDQITGPVMKYNSNYFGFSPGVPGMDVANMLAPPTGINSSFAGYLSQLGLSPAIKTPIEAMTKNSMQSGRPIPDASEYVDSLIPGVSKLSSASGFSASGSLLGMLTGNGLDPQIGVTKGNKGHFGIAPTVNYLGGVGMQNMSTPTTIKIGNLDNSARIKAEKLKAAQDKATSNG
jgi:DNA-directed RNA polymerase subunit F